MINERAVIVALSYVIGFTTAFIAFGVTQQKSDYATANKLTTSFSAETFEQAELIATSFEAFKNEDGFFVTVDGNEQIISARSTNEVGQPGFHFDVPYYEVSPTTQYVHYCEQMTEVPTECTHFIYVVDEHIVYPVTVERDGGLVSNISDMHTHWLDDGRLEIGLFVSESVEEPWVLEGY